MSYMQKSGGNPSFTECIISFWFRVPGESFSAIPWDGRADPSPVFNGVLPLLIMGEEGREEGEYDGHATPALWMTTDFTNQGPHYNTTAEFMGCECTGTFHIFLVWDIECCASMVCTTIYTATEIPPGPANPEEGIDDKGNQHKETYRVVYAPEPAEVQKCAPTCIGVTDDGYLYVNFQTNKAPELGGREDEEYVTSITPGENISTSGNMGSSSGTQTTTITYGHHILGCVGLADTSTTEGPDVTPGVSGTGSYKQPEEHKSSFPPLPPETGKFSSGGYEETGFGNNIKVSTDRWHHVLVSVKLQSTKTHSEVFTPGESPHGFDGGSLLYVALDNKNYIKDDLNGMWSWGGDDGESSIIGDNEVYPYTAWDYATDTYDPERGGQETYSLSDPEVPSGTIAIPASDKYTDYIQRVEMAELQIWFGQSFDTGDASNRRLFIDSKGKPEKPEVAEDALGKPDILVHGSGSWKQGLNKGRMGPPEDPDRPLEPWFEVTPAEDGIVRWKPDPSLGGPQSPAQGDT